jgi:hypothetical protein
MKRLHLLSGVCATVLTLFSLSANAALLSRLGGLAYYDDEADLTWLADADYAYTNPDHLIDAYGPMDWQTANDWAARLNIAGVTGWRLPDTLQPDASCDRQLDGGTFGPEGYGHNCTGSEMGNMFYIVLGGVAYSDITVTHNDNYDLFSNIRGFIYWSGTELADTTTSAWTFRFDTGEQRSFNKSIASYYAWAVHDGDVSAVPVPAAIWLFGTGSIALFSIARKKAA